MRNRLLLLGCLLYFSSAVFSQVFFQESINENLLKGRVKQVEEFFARFNNEEDWKGRKETTNTDSVYRTRYMRTLFDYSRFRERTGIMTPLAERFIQDVIKNNYQIHFTDSTWIAQVECKAMVGEKITRIKLFLRTQQVAPYEYVWCVSDYDTPLLQTNLKATQPFISPVEAELGFVGLLSLSSMENKNVSRLFPEGMQMDKLSILAFLLGNGMIKITNILDVSFKFFTIPGYSFTIKRIERKNSYNTGWLITNLIAL